MFFDVTVDESSDVASSSACLIRRLAKGQLVEQLVENFDRFLVLGLRVRRVRGYGLHDVESRHYDGFEGGEA